MSIQNTAQVTYVVDGTPSLLSSNTVTTSLNALVDVQNLSVSAKADEIQTGVSGYSYAFVVTNAGNATDRFDLSAGFTNLSSPVAALWIDNNHNGLLDPEVDTQIDANVAEIELASGANATILVLAQVADTMRLTATSLNEDPTAVVRHRSAITLTKTQNVDTQGASRPGSGTVITYALLAHVPAGADVSNIRIKDTIPAGTTYVPGSLSLDAVPVSDAADTDAGTFASDTRLISAVIPSSTESNASDHTVRFQVRIN